jgi:hypothetical protein
MRTRAQAAVTAGRRAPPRRSRDGDSEPTSRPAGERSRLVTCGSTQGRSTMHAVNLNQTVATGWPRPAPAQRRQPGRWNPLTGRPAGERMLLLATGGSTQSSRVTTTVNQAADSGGLRPAPAGATATRTTDNGRPVLCNASTVLIQLGTQTF